MNGSKRAKRLYFPLASFDHSFIQMYRDSEDGEIQFCLHNFLWVCVCVCVSIRTLTSESSFASNGYNSFLQTHSTLRKEIIIRNYLVIYFYHLVASKTGGKFMVINHELAVCSNITNLHTVCILLAHLAHKFLSRFFEQIQGVIISTLATSLYWWIEEQ